MPTKKNIFNEKTFVTWLLIVASTMLFIALLSAYWVHRSDGIRNNAWIDFTLPNQFLISTAIVIISSFFMQWAYVSAKKDNVFILPSILTITLILSVLFSFSQYLAWLEMKKMGFFFSNQEPGEISASFVYVLSGVHLFHIIGGIILIIIALVKSTRLQIHKKNLVFINICKTYWHFLGIVWIFLILFLYFAK